MKQDIYRLSAILLVSLFLGLLSGRVLEFILIGLSFYIYMLLRALYTLSRWIHRHKENPPPEKPGLIDDIAMQVDYLRSQYKRRKKRLASYIKRFKKATRSLPDAIILLGEHDEIEWANNKAGEYLGIRIPQDVGQRLVNLIRYPSLVNFLKESGKGKSAASKALELVSPANRDIYLELRLVPYADTGKLLVARDITKIYRINRMRTDFIANASHELRTPLTVISGYLETLEDDIPDSEQSENRSRITHMRNQTERMRRLIEDLLKLSSLETAEQVIHEEPVRVPDLIKTLIEEARATTRDARHKFSLKIDEDLWLQGDRNQIHSVISNIIYNAIQHTPDRGRITVVWHQDGDQAVFETADTGEGIGAEHIPRITERFYRVDRDRSREKGGTGLGLAIVKHILGRYNAHLEVESKLGEGSIFRCRFPVNLVIRKDIITDRSALRSVTGSGE